MTKRRILRAVAAACLIATSSVWFACSNDPAAEETGEQAAAEASQAPGLPDIELAQMGGGSVSAADLPNGKPLLVWFWAPW